MTARRSPFRDRQPIFGDDGIAQHPYAGYLNFHGVAVLHEHGRVLAGPDAPGGPVTMTSPGNRSQIVLDVADQLWDAENQLTDLGALHDLAIEHGG